MLCYLTKTLLCIFGLQPKSLGVRLHWVCVCLSPFRNECRARPARMWLNWMLLLKECPCGCWLDRRGWAGVGKMDGPFRLKQAFSTWSTCLPDARDRQRASMEGCVYSGKCVGQVSSLKAGFWLNLNEDIQQEQQQTADGRVTASLCLLWSVFFHPVALSPVHRMLIIDMLDLDVSWVRWHSSALSSFSFVASVSCCLSEPRWYQLVT